MNLIPSIVSFGAAKELAAAGFKQPDKQYGQFWYGRDGSLWIVGYKPVAKKFQMRAVSRIGTAFPEDCDAFIYAPSIIEVLPRPWSLREEGDEWAVRDYRGDIRFYDKDACEAAVKAWKYDCERNK